MGFRKAVSKDFADRMASGQATAAMNGSTSKGMSRWVNKDLQKAEDTGDWSELLAKAQLSTKYFRNQFYSRGRA